MSKYKCSETEQQINNVLKHQSEQLKDIDFHTDKVDSAISESIELLQGLGYDLPSQKECITPTKREILTIQSWEALCKEAEAHVGSECDLETIFTEKELASNDLALKQIREEFNEVHKLDKYDVSISAVAGILGAAVDILLVGIPQRGNVGLEAGPLSDYVRAYFDKIFPEDEMKKLANSKVSKVPFDAQDNRNTTIRVEGLSAYYHRLLQLGHDPVLGFVFGVSDILSGRMTTIDKNGKIVSQIMENYADRTETDIFAAIAKQIIHFKSDITTSMGLPAPLMSLFNLLQLGSIGEYEQTIAEIVQGMYYEGYDFIHFCAMSIPTMIIEVVIRLGYAFKRIKEGHSIKESIPFSLNREKHPKLETMLFIGHSSATAINAGKVAFTKNPLDINYPQWLAFAKYSYSQLKWGIIEKPALRDAYVHNKINEELVQILEEIDAGFEEFSKDYLIVME